MSEKIFAIINIGSSHITGLLATKIPGGKVNVLSEHSLRSQGVVHGCIHNIAEVTSLIDTLIDNLSRDCAQGLIKRVYVGVDCRSMRSQSFRAQLTFDGSGVVLEEQHIRALHMQAAQMTYPGQKVIHITEPRYFVDGKRELKPQGVRCRHIEASYQMIAIRSEIANNLYEVFEQRLGLELVEIIPAAIAEAQISLTKGERTLGCAYINIGGGTTSISLYKDRLLSSLYVLPVGGNNVTKDLCQLKLLEADAEKVKLRHASMSATVDSQEKISAASINGQVCSLSLVDINQYVYARMEEITANVLALLQEIDSDLQINALVFSGGATRLDAYIDDYLPGLKLGEDAVRYAGPRQDLLSEGVSEQTATNYHTALGIALIANVACVEEPPLPELSTLVEEVDKQSEEQTLDFVEEEKQEPIPAPEEESEYDWDETDEPEEEEDAEDQSEEEEDTDTLLDRAKKGVESMGQRINSVLGKLFGAREEEK